MAALSTQKPSDAGVAVSYAAAAVGGDSFVFTGKEFLHVKNGAGAPINVTISSGSNKCSFGVANSVHDIVVAVPAGGDRMIGPFDRDQFVDASGNVNISYSSVTTITVAVLAAA